MTAKKSDSGNQSKTEQEKGSTLGSEMGSDFTSESKETKLNIDHVFLNNVLSKVQLNTEQKKEVKTLFMSELDNAIASVKDTVAHESQETKKDFLTMFGIFVSFLTFISIEVQLFKTNNNVSELVGLSSLFLAFMMLFALVLTQLSKAEFTFKDLCKPIYIVTYSFLITGIILLINGNSISKEHDKLSKKIEKQEKSYKELLMKLNHLEINKPK